jgi:CheY-like chemotaxis protein
MQETIVAGDEHLLCLSSPSFHVSFQSDIARVNATKQRRRTVTPPTEHELLIDRATALARRSAWHATQSADLANEAGELLADAEKLQDDSSSSAVASRIAARSGAAVPHRRTVLIVDDDRFVTDTFATTLKLEGFDVFTACTAADAVDTVAARRPDLIFLDLHLPSTDGVTLLRALRSVPDHRETPVAVITGDCFLADGIMRELIELGAELRFKPIWTEELVALTHAMLKGPPN